jgi:hypothetical protein
MTEVEYDTMSKRLDSATAIKCDLNMLRRLRQQLALVDGDYFHLTTYL